MDSDLDIELLHRQMREIEDRFLIIENERGRRLERLHGLERKAEGFASDMETCSKAIEFVEKVASEERSNIKRRAEELISGCLHKVFDDTYGIEFEYCMKRARTSVEVYCLIRCEDGLVVRRGIDGIGGGVADAISLPLKLIVLLNDNALDRVLVIDEPGKHLSSEHVPLFAEFLRDVAKKLDVQIIMSSHHTCMDKYADSINEVRLEGSRSIVERVK